MPTYTYRCPSCGAMEKEIRAIEKRDEPKKCTHCGAETRRLIGELGGIHVVDGTRTGYA